VFTSTISSRGFGSLHIDKLEGRVLLAAVPALLDPLTQPKFVNPLPLPAVLQPAKPGGMSYQVSVTQFKQDLGLINPASGKPMVTTVWGYNGSYPGPTIEAQTGTPVSVKWINDLVDAKKKALPHLLPVDTTVHWAMPMNWPVSGVPIVTHLHGGHVAADSDGNPEAWFTPGFKQKGPDWSQQTFTYANDQQAATLWYHDHALGITRLNVYAGLAGFYLLRDANEASLDLPGGNYEIPLAIQDRMFTADGQLYYPSTDPANPAAPAPTILPEFFGNFIVVNGKTWPVLDVEPRKYRLRMLNGSDSRFYSFYLSSGQQFFQIGSDQGLLNAPVALNQLTLGPGERADVVLDFSDPALWNSTIVLKNNAKTPFPSGTSADPRTVGQIMAFRVDKPLDGADTSSLPASLRPTPIGLPGVSVKTRQLGLFEGTDDIGRIVPQLGTLAGQMDWDDPVTEVVRLGDTETWEIYNTTMDTHPIHLHLVGFRVLGRQKFTATVDPVTHAVSNITVQGNQQAPDANEAGWKDTVRINPGEVLRLTAKFDKPGKYVWHCHILSHEDNEMMRPLIVQAQTTSLVSVIAEPGTFAAAPLESWLTQDVLTLEPSATVL
jgi:spore coat protein A